MTYLALHVRRPAKGFITPINSVHQQHTAYTDQLLDSGVDNRGVDGALRAR